MRQSLLFLLMLSCLMASYAQWTTDPQVNAQLTPLDGQDRHREVLPAPGKSWYILYDHSKDNIEDVRLAKVDSVGNVLWDIAIYEAEAGGTRRSRMVPDGEGGVIVTWMDNRLSTSTNAYANRVNEDGDLLWGANDVIVGVSDGTEFCPKIISDGQGGAIIALFDDDPPEMELKGLYVYKLDANGQRLWRTLVVGSGSFSCSGGENSEEYDICTDNAGGVYVFFTGFDPVAPLENKVRGMRLNASGDKMWPDESVTIGPLSWPVGMTILGTVHSTTHPRAVANNDGTAYFLWKDNPGLADPDTPQHIRGHHLDADGNQLWDPAGLMLNTDHENSFTVHAISDDNRNLYFTFHDGDNYKLQRVKPDGSQPWGNGVNFRDQTTETVRAPVLTSCQDIIIAYFKSPSPSDQPNIYVTRIDSTSQFVWDPNTIRVSSTLKDQVDAQLEVNDHDELIAVWLDQSNAGTSTDFNIYMQGFYKSGDLSGITTGVSAPLVYSLSFAPNPAKDQVVVTFGDFNRGGRLTLTDALGGVVHQENITSGIYEQRIDISRFPAGFYTISLLHENYRLVAKLVVSQ